MGFEELRQEVRGKAAEEEKRILGSASEQAKQVLREAHHAAQAAVARARQEGEAVGREEVRKVSSAQLRAKKILAEAREIVIQEALSRLRRKLSELASAKKGSKKQLYEKLFNKLAKQAVADVGGTALIHCRKQDKELALRHSKAVKEINCAGGLVAENASGNVRVDNTFESLLEEREAELKSVAFKAIFGGASRKGEKRFPLLAANELKPKAKGKKKIVKRKIRVSASRKSAAAGNRAAKKKK